MKKFLVCCLLIGCFGTVYSQKPSAVISLTKSEFLSKVYNFEKGTAPWTYEGNMPCIIDFYANWCRPCRNVAPIIEEIAQKYEGKIIVYRVNIDREESIAKAFGIRSIPTFLYVPVQGGAVKEHGVMPLEYFERRINQILLK